MASEALEQAAAPAVAAARVWRFAKAVLHERSDVFEIDGRPVELERKPREVLIYLLERAGDVVTRDELLAAAWPGRIPSETVLPKAISRLREVLGDDGQTIIKTVHGYGYRLIAPVQTEVARSAPEPPPRFDFRPGDHPPLRPLWSLVQRLGSGGHGEAWLVRHDKTQLARVFKFAVDEVSLGALKREITLFRLLRDALGERARIVTLLDWNLEQAPYYFEAEYARGGSLIDWTARRGGAGAVPLATRIEIVAQAAEALSAIHSVGVLHKDLKPSNLLIEPQAGEVPRVLLGDFGCGGVLDARRLEAMGITRLGFTQTVNLQGSNSGTPLYLAPELSSGQPPTIQADVYALGVLLYQLVVGDLYRALSPGWEREVEDELLRADIAAAAEGDPEHRLLNAAELARRLRTLDERRARLAEERRAAQEAQARQRESERLQARRAARRLAFAAMAIGLATSTALYLDARAARARAQQDAARAQAVADFLSQDMFSAVGNKPLRELSIQELLEAAAGTLAQRMETRPEAAAQIHAALGQAFWKIERVADAQQHLDHALRLYEELGAAGSEAAVATAAQLVAAEGAMGRPLTSLERYERVIAAGRARLGASDPRLLDLDLQIARQRFFLGDWRGSAEDLQALIGRAQSATPPAPAELIALAQMHRGRALEKLGAFEASRAALQDARQRLAELPGAHPIEQATSHMWLGLALTRLERYDAAEAELDRAQEIFHRWAVGDRSAHLLSVQWYRAKLRLAQNRADEALPIMEQVVETAAGLDWMKSADHSYEFRATLARAYEAAGQRELALQQMRQALDIGTRTLGPRHPITQGIRLDLAPLVLAAEGPSAARRVLAGVDAAVIAGLGPDHPFVASQRRVDGLIALAEQRPQDARTALAEALRIVELRYGRDHAYSRRAREELAPLGS